jgi:hypothetical protein
VVRFSPGIPTAVALPPSQQVVEKIFSSLLMLWGDEL